MAILQPIIDLAALCADHGITYAVISPGSRSAALTMAFARQSGIKTVVVMDERSAGFIALGIAQQLKKPVALICTSGSAGYNFAPAVVEAFFQHIPLLVLTADRPKEWIHQQDGQTIFQTDLYGKHTKMSFELLSSYTGKDAHWFINRTVNEAILLTTQLPYGPVHINVPIEEPFYPSVDENYSASTKIRKIEMTESHSILSKETWEQLKLEWKEQARIVIAAGQQDEDVILTNILTAFAQQYIVIGDVISNLGGNGKFISKHDSFLSDERATELKPDLLITFGKSFISKSFKEFIRKNKPARHWHVGEDVNLIDTFQTLTKHVPVSPAYFFQELSLSIDNQVNGGRNSSTISEEFYQNWQKYNRISKEKQSEYIDNQLKLNDLTAFDFILNSLTDNVHLHVANSMSIRYVNLLGLNGRNIQVFANRGTSGIDGCVSTAIGAAMVNTKKTYLLVGDVAFLYDRNGFLLKSLPDNLKIIIFNNQGGTIFRLIDGPARQPELNEFFETSHQFTAERTAADSGISYCAVRYQNQLESAFRELHTSSKIAILEIFTDPIVSAKVYSDLKEYMKKALL